MRSLFSLYMPFRFVAKFIMTTTMLLLVAASGCSHSASSDPSVDQATQALSLDIDVFKANALPFVAHNGSGRFERYVVMNIPYQPVHQLKQQLERRYGRVLTDRGEAHITVITPPEYERMAEFVSIDEMNNLFGVMVQIVSFDIVCLGRAQKDINGVSNETFYLVAKAHALFDLREEIAQRYLQRGGPTPAFEHSYHPHITIGFAGRDLHASDGIVKSEASCVEKLDIG